MVRECLSGEVLLARSLLGGTQGEIAPLLREVADALEVPIKGVVSDGQHATQGRGQRPARSSPPAVPVSLPQEAAKEVYEADRHAKKELKKRVRGVRPIERELEHREDPEAEAIRGYCLAVRSAITDDGRPPLSASGIKLHDRLEAIHTSVQRVSKKGNFPEGSQGTRAPAAATRAWARPDGRTMAANPPVLLVGAPGGAHPEKRRGLTRRRATPQLPKALKEMSLRKEEAGTLSGAV